MTLRAYRPEDPRHERWVRDVVAALEPRARVSYVHDYAAEPIAVQVTGRRPLAVMVVNVRSVDGGATTSGGTITWEWLGDGQIEVSDISTITSGRHDVTLEIWSNDDA